MRYYRNTFRRLTLIFTCALFTLASLSARSETNPKTQSVAKVMGRSITEAQLLAETNRLVKVRIQRGDFDTQSVPFDKLQQFQNQALMNLMRYVVIEQLMDEKKIHVTDKEFNDFLDRQNKKYMRMLSQPLKDVVEMTEDFDTWKKRQRVLLRLQKYSYHIFNRNPDEQVKRFFEAKKDTLPLRRFRHIVITYGQPVVAGRAPRSREDALALITKARNDILSGKKSFSETAMEISEDAFFSVGGLMHFVSRDGKTVYNPSQGYINYTYPQDILKVVYRLKKVGDISEVFQISIEKPSKDDTPALGPKKAEQETAFHLVMLTDIRNWQSFRANYPEIDQWIQDSVIAAEIDKAKANGQWLISSK